MVGPTGHKRARQVSPSKLPLRPSEHRRVRGACRLGRRDFRSGKRNYRNQCRYVPGVRCRGALSRSERVRHAYDRSAYRPIAIHRRHFAWSESGPRAVICAGAARNCPVQQACQVRANLRYRAVNPISRMMRNADVFSTFVRCGTHLNRGVDPDGGLYPCDEVRQSWRH